MRDGILPVEAIKAHRTDCCECGFPHHRKDMSIPAAETIADRAERLAVIARLSRIYSPEFIAATYGVSE